ncbi:MAG: hypothetical protein Q9217_004396 [Psora testacea]
MSIYVNDYLPPCEGPKLKPFSSKVDINFLQRLNPDNEDKDSEDEEYNGQRTLRVFKVMIEGKLYALKVFKYFDVNDELFGLPVPTQKKIPLDIARYHGAPFFRECRAYGRMIDTGVNGIYAVECYGHLAIPVTTATQLIERFEGIDTWDVPSNRREDLFPAIVKEFVEKAEPGEDKWQMQFGSTNRLNELGIVIGKVNNKNYDSKGRAISLANSHILDYYRYNFQSAWNREHARANDRIMFQRRIEKMGIENVQIYEDKGREG